MLRKKTSHHPKLSQPDQPVGLDHKVEKDAKLLDHDQLVYDPLTSKPKRRRWLKITFAVFGLMLLVGGFFAARAALSINKVIQRNTGITAAGLKESQLKVDQLKGEGDGRINILMLGIGDPNHAGSNLSDTIMVMSIDPRTNDVAMLGIPRDMYVKIPGFGYDKINAANAYGDQAKKDGGPELAKKVVSDMLDIPIHYFLRVNFTGFSKAVDSVGGVEVAVNQSLYDPEYPCDRNEGLSCGFQIAAGDQKMNGPTALKYVRCRKGNCGDDFGRAKRQQQVMTALRDKAMQLNTLTNPTAISQLIDTIGNNVRTDLQLWEIKRLADIAQKVDQAKVVNQVLQNDGPSALVRTDMIAGASVVVPLRGVGDYTDIRALAHSIFADSYLKDEAARVELQDATGQPGVAVQVAALLKSYNYNVIKTTATDKASAQTKIIDYTGGKKPYTIKYLENRFGVKSETATSSDTSADASDIRISLGSDYSAN